MQLRQVTIKDIAKELSISTATVSRALRGVPEVSPQTRQSVIALANKLNYQPNQIAKSLVHNKTRNIGVIFPEVINLFFSSINKGIQDLAYKTGYNLIICYSNESLQREVEIIHNFLSYRVDGILVCLTKETHDLAHFEVALQRGVPLVFFDRIPDDPRFSSVSVDDYAGAYEAVVHLLMNGRKKIAHIAGPQHLPTFNKRAKAYRAALSEHQIRFNQDYLIHGGFTDQEGIGATRRLFSLPDPPDAIFAVSDEVALGASYVLKSIPKLVPDEVAVVGFSNESFSELVSPSLSTVEQNPYLIGKTAVRLLLEQLLTAADTWAPQQIVIQPSLIVRASSEMSVS